MKPLHGIYTALVTPFRNGEIDLPALRSLVRRQIDAGVHGLVPLGSTGEAATVTKDERARVVETVLSETAGRVPVVVGAGTNATATTVERVRQARELGADAAMVVTPYYNRPTPEGITAHVKAVAQAVDLPLVVYNVPSRTGTNMAPDLIETLAQIPAVVGLKEASGNLVQVMEILRRCGDRPALMSGEDALLLPTLAVGGVGLISTSSNIAPERFVRLYEAWTSGDRETARREQLALLPLIQALFRVTNPIAVKGACALMGLCSGELRLPLLPLEGAGLAALRADLAVAGLL